MFSQLSKNDFDSNEVDESKRTPKGATQTPCLPAFSVNLLAFYHECCSRIGYANHHLFGDR